MAVKMALKGNSKKVQNSERVRGQIRLKNEGNFTDSSTLGNGSNEMTRTKIWVSLKGKKTSCPVCT